MNTIQLEDTRSILIVVGALVAIGAYIKIVVSAFNRGSLWGVFSVFCPPVGGWCHCFGTWWETSKIFLAHAAGLALAIVSFLFFPRPQIYGYWTNESGDVVWRFDRDGTLRDFSLQADGKFSLRGYRILTRDLSVPSPLRLALSKQGEYHVGYHDPKTGSLMVYHEMKDPEIFYGLANAGMELHRVPDPENAEFKKKLAWSMAREDVYDAGGRLLASAAGNTDAAIGEALLLRYERSLQLARTATAAELGKLSVIEQVHALRLRAVYASEIKAGKTAAALAATDLKNGNYFIVPLTHVRVGYVNVDADLKQGTVVFVTTQRGDLGSWALPASPDSNGRWSIDLLGLRDKDIEHGAARAKTGGLAGALAYLNFHFQLGERPDLLRPLAP